MIARLLLTALALAAAPPLLAADQQFDPPPDEPVAMSVQARELFDQPMLTIVNDSDKPISRVFVEAETGESSGAVKDSAIASRGSLDVPIGMGCRFNVLVVYEDGTIEEKRGFDWCSLGTARFGATATLPMARPGAPPVPPPAEAIDDRPKPAAAAPRRRTRSGAMRGQKDDAIALPRFPWPAPKPVRQVSVPVAQVGGPGATLDQVLANLERGIARASPGYETGVFGGPPNGFVLLTRMERIQKDGAPFPGVNRFTLKGNPRAGFLDMLEGLLGEKPGYFRTIAFVVAGNLEIDPSKPVSSIPSVRDGAARLPPELGRQRLGNRRVFALVYAYERPDGAAQRPWTEGAPSALQHLRAAGIARWLGL